MKPGADKSIDNSFRLSADKTASMENDFFDPEHAPAEQQKQFTRGLLNASLNGIYSVKAVRDGAGCIVDFRYTFVNQAIAGMLQMAVEDIVGKTILDLFPENKTNGFFDLFCETLQSQEPYRGETYFQTQKITSWFDYSIVPVDDDTLLVTLLDTSENKNAMLRIEAQQNELRKANAELVRSNTNLREFAYAASHDLREPVRKIHFFADKLIHLSTSKWTEQEQVMMDRIKDTASKMNALIDDLFTYSQVSYELPDTTMVNLNDVLQKITEDLELQVQEKQAVISMENLPVIQANPRQMEELFHNLLTNSLKYAHRGVPPRITITSGIAAGEQLEGLALKGKGLIYWIRITDNGIGFRKEDATRIFNVFTRLHGNNEYEGNGVGLAIVQKVVTNHNGCITADGSPGEGATFTIILPEKQED